MYKVLLIFTILLKYCENDVQTQTKEINEKVQQLTDMSTNKPIISLNFEKFMEFVKSSPKDYAFVIMFTALVPSRRCTLCQAVNDEYQIVANSFRSSQAFTDKLFFGIVDFDEGFKIFQLFRLNKAPVIMHFPAKGKPQAADSMNFERSGIRAEAIARWVQDKTGVQILVFRPLNYYNVVMFATLFLLVAGFLYRRNNLELLYNRTIWAVTTVVFCFAMVSGQMWNQIREPPFFENTKNGPVYIKEGTHQSQLVLESYIVFFFNGAIVVGMIMMIDAAGGVRGSEPRNQADDKKRRFQTVVGLVFVCVFFSLLLSVFRDKIRRYPYGFLFN